MQGIVDDVADDVAAAMASLRGDPAPEPKADAAPAPEEAVGRDTDPQDPKDEPKAEKPAGERERDENGRFAAKEKAEPKDDPKAADPAKDAAPVVEKPAPDAKPEPVKVGPPGQWGVKAKAQWDRLPQVVRDEIARTSQADPAFGNLKSFADRARQSGQTLEQALSSYTGIEDLMRRDAAGGFMHVAANLGMTQHEAGSLFLSLAHRLGVMPQAQPGAAQEQQQELPAEHQALQQALAQFLNPLAQRLDQLDTSFRSQSQAQEASRLNSASSVVEQFRSDPAHRYYDNVEGDIVRLLNSGVVRRSGDFSKDLKAAYDMACRMNPEVFDALSNERVTSLQEERAAREREAAEKARNASRSITGSSPGASQRKAPERKPGASYDDDLYADVRAAIGQVAGRA